jgi:hypothetical protein
MVCRHAMAASLYAMAVPPRFQQQGRAHRAIRARKRARVLWHSVTVVHRGRDHYPARGRRLRVSKMAYRSLHPPFALPTSCRVHLKYSWASGWTHRAGDRRQKHPRPGRPGRGCEEGVGRRIIDALLLPLGPSGRMTGRSGGTHDALHVGRGDLAHARTLHERVLRPSQGVPSIRRFLLVEGR